MEYIFWVTRCSGAGTVSRPVRPLNAHNMARPRRTGPLPDMVRPTKAPATTMEVVR